MVQFDGGILTYRDELRKYGVLDTRVGDWIGRNEKRCMGGGLNAGDVVAHGVSFCSWDWGRV